MLRLKTYKHWTDPAPTGCHPLADSPQALVTQLEAAATLAPPDVIDIDPHTASILPVGRPCTLEPYLLAELPNARVFSHHGVIIDQSNHIVSDLVWEFNSYPLGNRVCHYEGLPEVREVDGAVLVLPSISAWKNYCHWIADSLPRLRSIQDWIDRADYIFTPLARPYHQEWLDHLGIDPAKIIEAKPDTHLRAKSLIVPSPAEPAKPHPSAVTWLREQIPGWDDIEPTRKIYIGRGDAWRRRPRNENEFIDYLAARGYESVTLSGMPSLDQARLFASSAEVIAPHGAALVNLVFSKPGTKVLELFPSDYIYPQYFRIAAVAGVRYAAHSSPCERKDPDLDYEFETMLPMVETFLNA